MAYQPLIPQPSDRLRTSQGDLLGNFTNAGGSGGLGTMLNPNQGLIQFPNQGAVPTVVANQTALYGRNPAAPYPLTAISELTVNKNSAAGVKQVPFTASILSTLAMPTPGTAGWGVLPNGLMIQWGVGSVGDTQNLTAVNFPVTFPVACLVVLVTVNNNANLPPGQVTPQLYNNALPSQTQFLLASRNGNSANTSGYTYFAIGY